MSLTFLPFDQNGAMVAYPFFNNRADRFCDRTVGVNYMWRTPFNGKYAITDGCLILQVSYGIKGIHFTYPIGENPEKALTALEIYCFDNNLPLQFASVSPQEITLLQARYPTITVSANRDFYDYLYNYTDLATFAGRRYSAQRNHINRFTKQWPNWAYSTLRREDVPAVKEFLKEYIARKTANEFLSRSEQIELNGCADLLDVMHDFGMSGGILSIDDRIIAFSIGEKLGDTLYVHCEKGDIRYPGVYQVMVREFASHNAEPTLRYINREDDSGDAGLRQSKLAYHPCAILEKSIVVVHNGKD